jgi:EAL domain-containing protein (putative c-di-GMP-specific phosphodiesterase class I)
MAFQPIVDVPAGTIFAHEALVRGANGQSAGDVLKSVAAENLYAFDQACRVSAIRWAARIAAPGLLSINFMPNAVYNPVNCLRATVAAAERVNWPLTRIIFEVTEHEQVADLPHLLTILKAYRAKGLLTAIDDFGAGHSGLNLLAEFQPDLLKLDMALVRGIDTSRARQIIVRHAVALAEELEVRVIAEGIETVDECRALLDLGVDLQQGFLFARPATEALPPITLPAIPRHGYHHGA